ncbi:hypothetical protein DL98DRAFT_191795 [Cadophora sp. DSE1049]|nr:hypothetical protein DL98DRAFT_191795 [Cadophora sp. DSE1049]
MMFVLGMWPLPPPGKWTIANNRIGKRDAATQMLEWFVEVERSKERIPDKYFLLRKMLAINPSHRITSSNSLQWVYLGRIVFEDSVPAEAIALSIEFTRLRICATSLAQSLMAEHIRDIILADAPLHMDGYGREYNANLYAIIPQNIESAAILPAGHPVRGVLAMAMEGFFLDQRPQIPGDPRDSWLCGRCSCS